MWMYWAASFALSDSRATEDGTVGNDDGIVKSIVETAKRRTMPRTMMILRGGIRLALGSVRPNSVCCTGIIHCRDRTSLGLKERPYALSM